MRGTLAVLAAAAALVAGTQSVAAEPIVPAAPAIVIAAQQYLPSGTLTTFRATEQQVLWTMQVRRGDVITVVNLDPVIPSFQHSVTSCDGCRAIPAHDTPTASGAFDTGVIPTGGGRATIDTAGLEPGSYDFFCKPHPWMRGAFAVA